MIILKLKWKQPSTNNYQLKVCGLTKINQIQKLISLNTDFFTLSFMKISEFVWIIWVWRDFRNQSSRKSRCFVNETVEKLPKFQKNKTLNLFNYTEMKMKNLSKFKAKVKQNKKIKVLELEIKTFDELENFNQQPSTAKFPFRHKFSKAFGGTGKTLIGKFSTK